MLALVCNHLLIHQGYSNTGDFGATRGMPDAGLVSVAGQKHGLYPDWDGPQQYWISSDCLGIAYIWSFPLIFQTMGDDELTPHYGKRKYNR